MSLSPDSSFSAPPLDALSNDVASSSKSTPPTTVADSASLHSDTSKHDVITVALDSAPLSSQDQSNAPEDAVMFDADAPAGDLSALPDVQRDNDPMQVDDTEPPGRRRRSRGPAPVYNLSKLSGTANRGKRRANGDDVADRRRRTIATSTVPDGEQQLDGSPARRSTRPKRDNSTIDALNLSWSPKVSKASKASSSPQSRRQVSKESPRPLRATRHSASAADLPSLSKQLTSGKRKSTGKAANANVPRELRRLEDTKEFSHVDEKPVIFTVWSNGKYVDPKAAKAEERARKKAKTEPAPVEAPEEEEEEPVVNAKQRRVKKYLDKGLYAGQEAPSHLTKGLTPAEKKKLAELPELTKGGRGNKMMPSPMYTGLRLLIAGRDFKLPFNVCNPLPPGQPKPDEWKKMTKNRFIGESREIWRKSPHFHDYQSKCVCKPEDGCGESCQNRIMLYECDETNCNVGRAHCTNRAFADLTARRAKGGKYRVGVEVIKTSDRGYGVRSNRCFKPHQIIMEYAGEIITEEECERRMNEVYKDNECYYLMSFDQNMIIDATSGSIARFVNHSCNPNCRMIKWIVSGHPRMALFAGDKPIMTGEELTYDYNFDPFSAKNVQSCLCGEENCRGVLGPKTREQKPKPDLQKVVKATITAGKRKLQDFMGGEGKKKKNEGSKPKKPRITSTKDALANVGVKMAKGTVTAIRKGISNVSKAKKAGAGGKPTSRGAGSGATKKTATHRVVKPQGRVGTAKKKVTSASRSTTVTAKAAGSKTAVKKTIVAKKTAVTKEGRVAKKKMTPIKATNKAARPKSAVMASASKGRSPKKTAAAPSAKAKAAEKKRQEELDRQYEITVAHPD